MTMNSIPMKERSQGMITRRPYSVDEPLIEDDGRNDTAALFALPYAVYYDRWVKMMLHPLRKEWLACWREKLRFIKDEI
jgi:hypothetical protein